MRFETVAKRDRGIRFKFGGGGQLPLKLLGLRHLQKRGIKRTAIESVARAYQTDSPGKNDRGVDADWM